VSASEKLTAVLSDLPDHVVAETPWPQIVAVVEAAEMVDGYFSSIGWTSDGLAQLAPALAALDEALQ
jgi:hypothetical protein